MINRIDELSKNEKNIDHKDEWKHRWNSNSKRKSRKRKRKSRRTLKRNMYWDRTMRNVTEEIERI
jgi:hypothetical protein